LIELLWPEDDPARTPKRLAVAVNVLRNVLDPKRKHDTDHFVAGDREGLRLELRHISVDVEEFLRRAQEALSRNDGALLEQAEASYTGEFLAEDVYVDWATPLRDEVRTTYQELLRVLALSTEDVRYPLRLLALDPYDEDSHLLLVRRCAAAGKHGEARRAYRRYVERMHELGLEPEPYEHASKLP
jgi:DNA-binding SARP family transcriptional activator